MGQRRDRLLACVILVAAALIGCGQRHGADRSSAVLFPRAIVTKEHVAEAARFEGELAKRYNTPPAAGQPWFAVLPGESRVLVVAGHATAHMREGKPKEADGGTGSLAYMINRLAGCPVIYTTHQSPSDPNYYDDNAFKEELERLIARHRPVIVLDLHGSNASRPYDVDFGTIGGGTSLLGRADLLERLAGCLGREGVRNFSQDFFPASRDGTVTRFVSQKLGVPCVQVEVNQNWMITTSQPGVATYMQYQRFAQLLQGIVRFVQSVDQSPGRGRASSGTRLLPSKISATRPSGSTTTDQPRASAGTSPASK